MTLFAGRSIQLRRQNIVARHIRTVRPHRHPSHGLFLIVENPLLVRSRDEVAPRIPAGDPGVSIIKTEEHALHRPGAFFQLHGVPATTFLHVVFEEVTVQDAAVDQRDRLLLINDVVIIIVARDKMPALTGDISVDTRNRTVPVLFAVDGAVDALTALEPVGRAKEGPEAEEEIRRHCRKGSHVVKY